VLAIIVPVRRDSKRLEDKPLHLIGGRALVLHTAYRLREIAPEAPLYFAVDDRALEKLLVQHGFSAILTDPNLPTGTDRVAYANSRIGATQVINCPCDEPDVQRIHLELMMESLRKGSPMATLALKNFTDAEFNNPNRVKVVVGADGNALYFSRAPIPYERATNGGKPGPAAANGSIGLHQGIYAYTGDFLHRFTQLTPTPLEKLEKLEQLRALEYGFRIGVRFHTFPTHGIDTIEDAQAFENSLRGSAQAVLV